MQVILKVDKAKARLGASVFLRYGEIAIDKDGRMKRFTFPSSNSGMIAFYHRLRALAYVPGYRASSFHPGPSRRDLIFGITKFFPSQQRRFDTNS
jgi:hypothetical protein